MIIERKRPYTPLQVESLLHPIVKRWFYTQFKEFAPPQLFSLVPIHRRENILISSPTGSGKTLSAFLSILNELVGLSLAKELEDRIYAVYISPLKALANDIDKNLNTPLKQIKEILKKQDKKLNIRVGVRTGDTSPSKKSAMLRKPPHILITTPESLAIMLTTKKFKENFNKTQWVIVDEIHALADNKRGSHLSVSLERLHTLAQPTRVGLSATVSPIKEVAKYLVGYENSQERNCIVVDVNYLKQLDLKVLCPVENLITTPFEETQTKLYKLIDTLIQQHKTTLIFTNTRSGTEKVVHHLKQKFPKNYTEITEQGPGSKIGAHHGSLSKDHRLKIESQLKEGKLKAVVSSTSLELGIDIGYIDLVILLGSPKSVARALQRIGRSGHKLHDKAKGRIIVLDRDDLVECAVLLKAAIEKKVDKIAIPRNCLDVLVQHIFAIAIDNPIGISELYTLLKQSYTYHHLSWEDYMNTIDYLSGKFAKLEDRSVYAKIWYDEETAMIGKRGRLARVLYMTNVGTIPDETRVKVKVNKEIVGYIEESFLERLKKNDVFVLGGNTYQFLYSQGLTAFCKGSVDRPPTIPRWVSEMLPLSYDLAIEIQKFRTYIEELLNQNTKKKDILEFIHSYLYLDTNAAESLYEYFHQQYHYAKIPHNKRILIEYYNGEYDTTIIFHTLYGRRTNDVLSRAVGFVLGKIHKKDFEIGITDNGFTLRSQSQVQARRALTILKANELRQLMEDALDTTEVLGRRFRHCAARSLMILRNYLGRTKSVGRQARSSRLLIAAVRRIDKNFPVLKETKREILEDHMDIQHAETIIQQIQEKKIEVSEITTEIPSPFAFNLVAQGYSDIIKMSDRQEFLKKMHNMILLKISLKENKKIKKEKK